MTFGEKIKLLRTDRNMSQEEFASLLGTSKQVISRYELGQTTPKIGVAAEWCKILSVNLDSMLDDSKGVYDSAITHTHSKGVKIPVLGQVVAGLPLEAIQDILDYEEISPDMAETGNFFALQIKGDSMEPRIKAGDVVIVRQQSDVESGQIAIVLVNGDEATCKKYVKHENGISLVSFNAAYPPMFYTPEEIEKKPVRIIGRVVELRGKF